MTSQEL